jgi:dTDP-4-dehydrorhamnose reductase
MKVAVTGSRGQLARSLLDIGPRRGVEVIALGRPELDIADEVSVTRAVAHLDVDVLVNAAAYTAVERAEAEEGAAFAVNANGAGLVARACARRGIPIIQVSTDYVFDGEKLAPYVETDATGPVSVYGRSKAEGECQVARLCAEHIILRTSWVHSPYGSNFVKTMLRLGSEREEVFVVNDQLGCPTYAPDLAHAIVCIAQRICDEPGAVKWGVFHCANSGEASWYDVAVAVFRASEGLGRPPVQVRGIPSSAYPTAAKRPMNSRLDTTKLADEFNVRLPDWRQGIASAVSRLLMTEQS